MTLTHATDKRGVREEKTLWRANNRNALRQIADKFDLSYTFVRRVFLGEMASADLRVEKELKKRGCPGF